MSRPVYETAETEHSEEAAARLIGDRLRCEVVRNKKFYPADYSFLRDRRVVALGEIKVRRNLRAAYPTFFISAEKLAKCRQLASDVRLPFALFVWWLDGIFYLDASSAEHEHVTVGGRRDRGDPSDVEPLVHFSITAFRSIESYGEARA